MKNKDIKDILFMVAVAIFLVTVFLCLGLKLAGMDNKFLQFPAAVMFVALGMAFGTGLYDIFQTRKEENEKDADQRSDDSKNGKDDGDQP